MFMKKFLSYLGRGVAYAMLIAAFAASVSQTAHADWHGHRGPPPRHHHWHPDPRPREIYAPAPVVYAPPPPVSPGLNLILPIHIR
jgi:hypothetical protein